MYECVCTCICMYMCIYVHGVCICMCNKALRHLQRVRDSTQCSCQRVRDSTQLDKCSLIKRNESEWCKREKRIHQHAIRNPSALFLTLASIKFLGLSHSGRKECISLRRQDRERSIAEISCSHILDTLLQNSSKCKI